MALGSALVDKARVHRTLKTSAKLQGTLQTKEFTSEWFRCRVTMPRGSEQTEEGRRKKQKTPELMCGRVNVLGEAVEILAGDTLELQSVQLGNVTLQIAGDPEPIRKRRSIIGWQVGLSKVE